MTEEHQDRTKSELMLVTVQYGQYFMFLMDSTPHSDLNSLKNTLAWRAQHSAVQQRHQRILKNIIYPQK